MKHIIHLDLDAFYTSVEVLDNPDLKGKPVIVGGSKERGVVASASYEARRFGIHSAQPMAAAMRLCPAAIVLPGRMGRYSEVSHRVFEIFHRFTPLVESLSLDEAFLDVTSSLRLFGTAEAIARAIKHLVHRETGLTISAGVAPLKFVAKIASDFQKPDGLTIVPPDHVAEFLDPLPIGKLWGIGEVTEKLLVQCGVHTIGDLRCLAPAILEAKLGKHGVHLYQLAWGIEDSPVEPVHVTKSIGREETFPVDIIDKAHAWKEVLSLSIKTVKRLREEALQCGTITLKVKYNDFKQITRSVTLPVPTNDRRTVWNECRTLLQKTEVGTRPVRLLGIALSGLQPDTEPRQRSLFSSADTNALRDKNLNGALDHILDRFGENAIMPGTLLRK
nr:DNA polymerase IV [Deltaproteobacteria bacterium]